MTAVLAIDTSSSLGGVAVCRADQILFHRSLGEGLRHGRLLIPAVDEALKGAGLRLADIDAIACGIGPGSYTGTRVGVMTAKALAFGANKPCIPVSSLAALALGLRGRADCIIPAQDARRDEIYTAVYRFAPTGLPQPVRSDVALSPEETAKLLELAGGGKCLFAGSALEKYPEVFSPLQGRAEFLPQGPANLAEAVGLLACAGGIASIDAVQMEPLYMRRDDAPCTFERFMN